MGSDRAPGDLLSWLTEKTVIICIDSTGIWPCRPRQCSWGIWVLHLYINHLFVILHWHWTTVGINFNEFATKEKITATSVPAFQKEVPEISNGNSLGQNASCSLCALKDYFSGDVGCSGTMPLKLFTNYTTCT